MPYRVSLEILRRREHDDKVGKGSSYRMNWAHV